MYSPEMAEKVKAMGDLIYITEIRLETDADDIVVCVKYGGGWLEVIRTHIGKTENAISHILSGSAIRKLNEKGIG